MIASAVIIFVICRFPIPTARIAPYCFILADTLMEILFIMFNIVMNEIIARKPYLLHCPDGCALMDGGKKLYALTLIASVVDTNVKPLFRKLGVA